ncbi:MAG: hypothetical protein WC455_02005 [Dehalococcoidia bacterium]|jgi:hypothetical protein
MLRIANPGSDISTFIRIYIELYEALGNRESFGLDDISETLIERNLATSCGYTGKKALERSTRADRSRDPLYNQSKMYSELYKVLGWLHPLPDSALTFQFTYLGAHVTEVRRAPVSFFRECLLGLVYPNEIISISGNYILRPFATILRTMAELDGIICRDEMIIGPLCLEDDRNGAKFSAMTKNLKKLRGNWGKMQKELDDLSLKRKISKQTMENYTRFPIAALKWTGWAGDDRRRDIYSRSIPFLVLTDEGYGTVQAIKSSVDVRASNLARASEQEKAAVSRIGFYQMLERAGFELSPVRNQINQDLYQAKRFLGKASTSIIFSPFQELEPVYTKSLFPTSTNASNIKQKSAQVTDLKRSSSTTTSTRTFSRVTLGIPSKSHSDIWEQEITELFKKALSKAKNINGAVEEITITLAKANKEDFYPLVAGLFRTLGYNCEHSRPGVNYERWDAFISHPTDSIPIEIKSPGEEEFISTKAVRQALENKIILLARQAFPTRFETTSLVVGYNLPNDRSEVLTLVDNIFKAYNVVIGVIDIRSLLRLVAAIVVEGKKHNPHELINLRGIINVSDS